MMESVANITGFLANMGPIERKANTSIFGAGGDANLSVNRDKSSISNVNAEDISEFRSRKESMTVTIESSRIGDLNESKGGTTLDGGKVRKRISISKKVKANKFLPTNFGNQIEVWADSVYNKYGEEDRLTFEGFNSWAQRHRQFIFNFRKYFRYNLWKAVVNAKTNQLFLHYALQTPFLQDNIEILQGLNVPIKSGYAALYVDFLFVWRNQNIYVLPARVLILKNIRITFEEHSNSIEFLVNSKKYKPLKIKLSKVSIWKFWKETLEKYSRQIHKR